MDRTGRLFARAGLAIGLTGRASAHWDIHSCNMCEDVGTYRDDASSSRARSSQPPFKCQIEPPSPTTLSVLPYRATAAVHALSLPLHRGWIVACFLQTPVWKLDTGDGPRADVRVFVLHSTAAGIGSDPPAPISS